MSSASRPSWRSSERLRLVPDGLDIVAVGGPKPEEGHGVPPLLLGGSRKARPTAATGRASAAIARQLSPPLGSGRVHAVHPLPAVSNRGLSPARRRRDRAGEPGARYRRAGAGVVARAAARRGAAGGEGHVVASDVLAARCWARAATVASPERRGADRVRGMCLLFLAPPFEDSSFDYVLCQQGLQFFPARAAAIGEMRRVSRPAQVSSGVASGRPLVPFGVYGDELAATGTEQPFPERVRQ